MNFTDLFIRKPVVATVVSLLILVLGLRSIFNLPVNQYPKTENGVVIISWMSSKLPCAKLNSGR